MSKIIVSTPGRRYKFRKLEFWAERGLIHIFDFRISPLSPIYHKCTVRDFALRADGFNQSIQQWKYPGERREHEQLVENMIHCCREAQAQGRPDDQKTWDYLAAQRKNKHYLAPERTNTSSTEGRIITS